MAVSVTVIGSADAFNTGGRGNACFLVQDGGGAFCVDFGPTALEGLKRIGFDPADLDAVFLTHLHGDHFGGLHLLYIDAQYRARRRRPLVVGGPAGIERRVEEWYRIAYGEAGGGRPYETRYLEWPPGWAGRAAGRRVRTSAAKHMRPEDGALHLRIRTDGRELAFSGDTAWHEGLPALADGADLLICECTNAEPCADGHLSWQELEARLEELRARRIALTHLGPAMRGRAKSLAAPRVRFAEDGMVLRLRGDGRSSSMPLRSRACRRPALPIREKRRERT